MSNGKLKPGTPCFLTKTKWDSGVVVEVLQFGGVHPTLGDFYCVKSKTPIRCEAVNLKGENVGQTTLKTAMACFRFQLIPITPPENDADEFTQKQRENTINQGN